MLGDYLGAYPQLFDEVLYVFQWALRGATVKIRLICTTYLSRSSLVLLAVRTATQSRWKIDYSAVSGISMMAAVVESRMTRRAESSGSTVWAKNFAAAIFPR